MADNGSSSEVNSWAFSRKSTGNQIPRIVPFVRVHEETNLPSELKEIAEATQRMSMSSSNSKEKNSVKDDTLGTHASVYQQSVSLFVSDFLKFIQKNVSFKIFSFIWLTDFNDVRFFSMFISIQSLFSHVREWPCRSFEITLKKKTISSMIGILQLISFSNTDREKMNEIFRLLKMGWEWNIYRDRRKDGDEPVWTNTWRKHWSDQRRSSMFWAWRAVSAFSQWFEKARERREGQSCFDPPVTKWIGDMQWNEDWILVERLQISKAK